MVPRATALGYYLLTNRLPIRPITAPQPKLKRLRHVVNSGSKNADSRKTLEKAISKAMKPQLNVSPTIILMRNF